MERRYRHLTVNTVDPRFREDDTGVVEQAGITTPPGSVAVTGSPGYTARAY
jgi:hypothetical protein